MLTLVHLNLFHDCVLGVNRQLPTKTEKNKCYRSNCHLNNPADGKAKLMANHVTTGITREPTHILCQQTHQHSTWGGRRQTEVNRTCTNLIRCQKSKQGLLPSHLSRIKSIKREEMQSNKPDPDTSSWLETFLITNSWLWVTRCCSPAQSSTVTVLVFPSQ